MNVQQAVQPRSPFYGRSLQTIKKDSSRMDNSLQPGQLNPNKMPIAGIASGGVVGELESLSRDRLVYLTTCLIGHHVEVQIMNGSVFSGVFHASNADGDFGVVLKMAHVKKDVSARGQRDASDSMIKAQSKTLIIPPHELVQVVAKDLPITSDGQSNELQGVKWQDIMLDSCISQSHPVELERELQPWMPDEDDPQCSELENIFDSPWTGSWDQFKVNETLFGVKSTFNEEFYTTKLDRGPQMRKLEQEALKIVREIEGEQTHDLHLAEERGIYPHSNIDVDEETKYSSVNRGDDSGYADGDIMLHSYEMQAPKKPIGRAFGRSFADVTSGKNRKGCEDGHIPSGSLSKVTENVLSTKDHDESNSLWDAKKNGCEIARVSSVAAKREQKASFGELSTSSTSDSGGAMLALRFRPVSPCSSVGSLSSEKSTLTPDAKEFKLNPNAKSFVPSQSPIRPMSPVNDSSFYYAATMSAVPHMQGMPVGTGVGPAFAGNQPVFFTQEGAPMQSHQAYFPANGRQYGQPMILGHPRPVIFMPGYPTN